jgi:hypothetical protein
VAVTAQGSGTKTSDQGGTFTVTIASPGVFTKASNQLSDGDRVVFSTSGALPTGLTAGTTYFVRDNAVDGAGKFRVAATEGGAAINTSGTQSGTQTISSSYQILLDVAVAGTFTFHMDTNAMASGDFLELRIYQIVLTGGTRRVAYFTSYADAQAADDIIKISVPISNELTDAGSLRFEMSQRAGTMRAFPWKVLKYA